MLGSDNSLIMAKLLSDNIKAQMGDQLSLNKQESDYIPLKSKSRFGFKKCVLCVVILACAGLYFVNPVLNNNNIKNYSNSIQY